MNAIKEWPSILEFAPGTTISEQVVEKHYRKLAKRYHPDAGGTVDDMQQLNEARRLALCWITRERTRQEELKRAHEVAERHFAAAQQSLQNAYAQQQINFSQFANSFFGTLMGQQSGSEPYKPVPEDEVPAQTTVPIQKTGVFVRFCRFLKGAK